MAVRVEVMGAAPNPAWHVLMGSAADTGSERAAVTLDRPRIITYQSRLNDVRRLNRLFAEINARLEVGGLFIGFAESGEQRKQRLLSGAPRWLRLARYAADYVLHRVLARLTLTKRAYLALTRGHNRVISRAELLGRLVYAGFEITRVFESDGLLYVVAKKGVEPAPRRRPSEGLILKMERVGPGGRPIQVYKVRTMHPYAEYLQAQMHQWTGLAANGKYGVDFRVTTAGRLFRRYWLDELPMLFNLLKGDLKLVGVRPLTEAYLSLYPDDLVQRRMKCKPGLIPPFYADMPKGLEAIIESERRYLDAFEARPLATDLRYLCAAVRNIVFRGARSQ